MGRILAIDYGTKRTGIAVTDELQIIANGLTTIPTSELLTFLTSYLNTEKVDTIVFGQPKQMNGTASEIEPHIKGFIKKLRAVFPSLNIERCDERFTSKMAFDTMLASGINKKQRRDKNLVDTISATIILQTYLESKRYGLGS